MFGGWVKEKEDSCISKRACFHGHSHLCVAGQRNPNGVLLGRTPQRACRVLFWELNLSCIDWNKPFLLFTASLHLNFTNGRLNAFQVHCNVQWTVWGGSYQLSFNCYPFSPFPVKNYLFTSFIQYCRDPGQLTTLLSRPPFPSFQAPTL